LMVLNIRPHCLIKPWFVTDSGNGFVLIFSMQNCRCLGWKMSRPT
jgi:hypothetical protein